MTAGSTPLSLYARHDDNACAYLLVWAQVRFYWHISCRKTNVGWTVCLLLYIQPQTHWKKWLKSWENQKYSNDNLFPASRTHSYVTVLPHHNNQTQKSCPHWLRYRNASITSPSVFPETKCPVTLLGPRGYHSSSCVSVTLCALPRPILYRLDMTIKRRNLILRGLEPRSRNYVTNSQLSVRSCDSGLSSKTPQRMFWKCSHCL